jgi:hypothetical protein
MSDKNPSKTFDPLAELDARASRTTRLFVRRRSERDEALYYLFKDDDLAVISTKPFLGERGKRPSFVCVSGVVSHQPTTVSVLRSLAGLKNKMIVS